MHRGRERTSYVPFLLNQETRSDVIPVHLRFSDTLPQARQPISHWRVCLNNGLVTITHFKVSQGDLISFKENDARTRGEEIRRSLYIDISVGKIIGKFLPVRICRRTKTEWFRLLTTQRGCRLLLKSRFLQELCSRLQHRLDNLRSRQNSWALAFSQVL
jgi:small subunit ribosomal protein S4